MNEWEREGHRSCGNQVPSHNRYDCRELAKRLLIPSCDVYTCYAPEMAGIVRGLDANSDSGRPSRVQGSAASPARIRATLRCVADPFGRR